MTRRRRNTQTNYSAIPTPGAVVINVPGAERLPDNKQQAEKEPWVEIGVTGLAQFTGLIFQEPLTELRGKEAYKRYDEMRRNSPIISALLLSIENPIRGTSWNFSSDKGDNDPRLILLNDAITNMQGFTFNDHVSEVLTMLPFGYSLFEPVYEKVGGRWLWKKFAPRAQNTVLRWIYEEIKQCPEDPNSPIIFRLAGFEQLAPPKFKIVPIPIEKLILYKVHTELENPEGRSILRSAWIPYYFIKHLQQIEAIALERLGPGFPVINLPPGASTGPEGGSDASKAAKMVRNVRIDEQAGLVLPDGWKFEFSKTGGTTLPDFDKVINRYEKRILTSVLAQFLMLGQEGIGSLALSKDQTDFFTMSVNSTADIIAETFTHTAIPMLMELNGYDADGLALEHTPAQGETGIMIMADFLQKAGPYLHLTPEDEVWLRQLAGMPEKSVEEIQQLWDDTQAAQAQVAAKVAAAKQSQAAPEPAAPSDNIGPDVRMGTDMYAAQARDKARREKMEKAWAKAIKGYQEDLKKKVLAGMK